MTDDVTRTAEVRFGKTTVIDDSGIEHEVIVARGQFGDEVKYGFGDTQREATENLFKTGLDVDLVKYTGRAAWLKFPDERTDA